MRKCKALVIIFLSTFLYSCVTQPPPPPPPPPPTAPQEKNVSHTDLKSVEAEEQIETVTICSGANVKNSIIEVIPVYWNYNIK